MYFVRVCLFVIWYVLWFVIYLFIPLVIYLCLAFFSECVFISYVFIS